MRGVKWVSLVLALIAVDTMIKLGNETPEWGWHVVETSWVSWIGIVFFALCTLWPVVRIPMLFGLAGAIGNTLWEYNPRGVPNPFVADGGSFNAGDLYMLATWDPGTVAFNMADVFIWFASAGVIVTTTVWSIQFTRRWYRAAAMRNEARAARHLTKY